MSGQTRSEKRQEVDLAAKVMAGTNLDRLSQQTGRSKQDLIDLRDKHRADVNDPDRQRK